MNLEEAVQLAEDIRQFRYLVVVLLLLDVMLSLARGVMELAQWVYVN